MVLTMLGAVTALAGGALLVTTGSGLGIALLAFGGVLLALGVVQHLLYRRDLEHWPEKAALWADGLELVLHNGEVRGASWTDPDFALQMVSRKAPSPADREFLMIWLMDSKIPPVELSEEGFDQLRRVAVDLGLQITHGRRTSRSDSNLWVEIRQNSAASKGPVSKTNQVSGLG